MQFYDRLFLRQFNRPREQAGKILLIHTGLKSLCVSPKLYETIRIQLSFTFVATVIFAPVIFARTADQLPRQPFKFLGFVRPNGHFRNGFHSPTVSLCFTPV